MQRFTRAELAARLGISTGTAYNYTAGWLRRGWLVALPTEPGPGRVPTVYAVTEAGLATQDDLASLSAIPRETKQGNMWRAIRGLPSFTALDVAAHACTETCPVEERDALDYCQALVRAGYLRVLRKARPGHRPATYKLVRNTGPRPPRERRVRGVWDDNLGEFTHVARALK